MRRTRWRGSTIRSRDAALPSRRRVDVYLLPSAVGGGRGDIEEVLLVGRDLARAGHRVRIVRRRPLALLDDPSFDWTGLRRDTLLVRRHDRAVTVSSQFGVTAADGRDEPLGRAGPWAVERAEIDRRYGVDRALHLSLEEFARARPPGALAEERWREAGRAAAWRRARRSSREFAREVAGFVGLYRKFRALDVPNLLTLFPTFRRSTAFEREFPESVQTGPLWPEPLGTLRRRATRGPIRVLWYASPSTSDRLVRPLLAGLARAPRPVRLWVRSPHPLSVPSSHRVRAESVSPHAPEGWQRLWATADLAIVTGTRSLLEAIGWGVPFLYYNGAMGRGGSTRRHRPEKIATLLDVLRSIEGTVELRQDLSDFARLRRIEATVARVLARPGRLPPTLRRSIADRCPDPFGDGRILVAKIVERFAQEGSSATDLIRSVRSESRRTGRGARDPASKV